MATQANRLDTEFGFRSDAPLQRDLQNLTKALEARFAGVEAVTGTFEDEVQKFEELGLSRLNDVLTPLASEAITRLQDITQLFGATSTTQLTIGMGQKLLTIPVDQRNTYVPTPYIAIYETFDSNENGMIARRVSLNRETGILTVDVIQAIGSGTFSAWELSVSPAPSAGGYTKAETDTVVDDAITALGLTALFAAKAPLVSPALTGSPTAPTQSFVDNSTKIATTYWVNTVADTIAQAIVDDAIAALPAQILDEASVAHVRGATVGSHAITTPLIESASASVGLSDAPTISMDWKNGINFTVTLGGNRTLGNPSNGIPGTWRTIQVTQDANGTRTLAYGNQYVFPGGAAGKPVIGTGNAAVSRISIYCRTTSIFEVYGMGIGLSAS